MRRVADVGIQVCIAGTGGRVVADEAAHGRVVMASLVELQVHFLIEGRRPVNAKMDAGSGLAMRITDSLRLLNFGTDYFSFYAEARQQASVIDHLHRLGAMLFLEASPPP